MFVFITFVCLLKAAIVSSREYQSWREKGVAFQLRGDAPYEHSNRTLASGLIIRQVSSNMQFYNSIVVKLHVHVCTCLYT